jgi:hypothetical protein
VSTPAQLPPGPDDRDPRFSPGGVFNEAKFEFAVRLWVAERDALRMASPELRPVKG